MTREEQLFNEALALPPADRAAFVARACADDEALHRRLAELLDAYASSGDFLAAPALPPPSGLIEEKPGDVLGRYTLVSKLGEGGCGSVYLAEQHEPVRRHVALKVIKLGMDTREVIARFEAERQALALMDHPNIARVFDAGATAAGRPYFVMEFVDGVPITQFCDTQQLAVPERLDLFARLCLALQHAHQKGIIHRDLKPSNILVTLVDGVPTPKIIDFGIAKATQGKLTAHTLVTHFEQMIGTPVYMSPEQADLRDTDIDTRSDIYSLGVLLYELLAGRPPFDPQSLLQAGVAEIRRIIRETDPPRPSAAVSTLADADRTTVAQRRRASPARLPSALRGDLDWIVMRCLEKQRDRRYGTAEELGRDIRRHLSREPVTARPPSALYRTRKFISRHRLACASAAALAVALLAGAAVSTWQAIRATRAEHEARLAQSDAQRRQAEAEDLLGFMLGDFRTALKKIGKLDLLDAVGNKAETYYNALDPRDQSDVALTRYAKALTQIGEIRLDEARYNDAEAAFRAAHLRAAALATRHPQNADMLFERAQAEYWMGSTARRRGDFAAARVWFAHYRDSALALVTLEGRTERAELEVAYASHNLAVLDFDNHDLAAAKTGLLAERAALENRLAGSADDRSLRGKLADNDIWLGLVAEGDGDYPQALRHMLAGASAFAALDQREPAANWKFRQANCLGYAGDIHQITGRRDAAATTYQEALALLDRLAAGDPENIRWALAVLNMKLCQVRELIAAGRYAEAHALLTDVTAGFEARLKSEPSSRIFQVGLATASRLAGAIRFATGQPEAEKPVLRACTLGETLVRDRRADNRAVNEYAQACLLAGRIAQAQGRAAAALERWKSVLELLTPRLAHSRDWRLLDPAAQALLLTGDRERALPLIEQLHRAGYLSVDPLAAPLLGAPRSNR